MEGSRRQQSTATIPSHTLRTPAGGWRQLAASVKEGIAHDNLSILSGGTAFFLLLGLVPSLAALISIFGLIANPSDIEVQFNALSEVIPTEARTLLEAQMTRIASQRQSTGITA